MKGNAPKTILTDQNMWLKDSVSVELPITKHAFCIWHILAKFSDWFSVQLGSKYDNWKAEFHRLYNLNSVDEFEVGWSDMINAYGLHGNKHIISLYALRTYWALPFLRSHFFAGMTSASQAESINVFIQRILFSQSQLDRFVEQVSLVVDYKDQAGTKQKMQHKLQKVHLKTGSPIESHASTVLTPYAFCKLQEELVLAPQYASFQLDECCFHVRHHTQVDGGCKVNWVPRKELIFCSCQQFEFSGIVCRHVLRVLSTSNCFHIPDLYLPTRWCDASFSSKPMASRDHGERIQLLQSMVSTLISESAQTDDRLSFACEQVSISLSHLKDFPPVPTYMEPDIACDSTSDSLILAEVEDSDGIGQSFTAESSNNSIAYGMLNGRRLKDGVEFSRKKRHFPSPCGQFGHDTNDCRVIGNEGLNGDELGFL
ncbi:Far1-related sequence 11-like [Thalictrum thalictroides]|uniref:Protein FAR1-RELATED SEQUENCE n=1 Tax=Thalictrum thalictroides TaxID=46969 RepID=A0A7J6X4C9_THATH|nr:Far1-related sequence 11-like [Thalictrum thalictroides]